MTDNTPRRGLDAAPAAESVEPAPTQMPERAAPAEAPERAAPAQTPERAAPTKLDLAKKGYSVVSDIFTPQRLAVGGAAGVMAVAGALGGFEAVSTATDELPVVEVAEVATAAPFEITVNGVRYGETLGTVAPEKDGVRYLFVVADVTNTAERPVYSGTTLNSQVRIDADGLLPNPASLNKDNPASYRTLDQLGLAWLQPGVTVPTVFIFEQDAAEPLPEEVTVTLSSSTWRASLMDGSFDWRDAAPAVEIVAPVKELGAPE